MLHTVVPLQSRSMQPLAPWPSPEYPGGQVQAKDPTEFSQAAGGSASQSPLFAAHSSMSEHAGVPVPANPAAHVQTYRPGIFMQAVTPTPQAVVIPAAHSSVSTQLGALPMVGW